MWQICLAIWITSSIYMILLNIRARKIYNFKMPFVPFLIFTFCPILHSIELIHIAIQVMKRRV